MKSIIKSLFIAAGLVLATSCELDLLDDPNEVSTAQVSPDLVLNNIQLEIPGFFVAASQFGMDETRMLAFFGNTYESALQSVFFNGIWDDAYSDILNDSQLLIDQYATNDRLDYHAGMANFFKAYTLMLLVDYFGDVPMTEALDPNNFNPVADADENVYAAVLVTIDDAIAAFEAVDDATDLPETDLYYGGDVSKWITACKTLKLKYYVQTRLADEAASVSGINALIMDNDLIDTNDEAFVFQYSTGSVSAPDTRHPWFTGNYLTGAGQYMSNSYMNELYVGHGGITDPRIRYYFYRQTGSTPTDVNVLDCIAQQPPAHYGPSDVFCAVGDGYFGRDHLDDDGIPPDTQIRTIYGLYPAGGQFDDDEFVAGTPTSGAAGAGIVPILMPSFTFFMLAESAQEIGTTGDARDLLEAGVTSSIDYVRTFQSGAVPASSNIPSDANVASFIGSVMADFDAASNKLDFMMKQYWVALWGNGVEMYNTYRRTTFPSDLQPALNANPGEFYRSFIYPADFVNLNSNGEQKASPAVQVFWDTNPAGSVD